MSFKEDYDRFIKKVVEVTMASPPPPILQQCSLYYRAKYASGNADRLCQS